MTPTPNTWGRDRTGDLAIMSGALSPSELPRPKTEGRSAKGGATGAAPSVSADSATLSADCPGIMRNGGAPQAPALPCGASATERHRTPADRAVDSATRSAKNGTGATPRTTRRALARLRREWHDWRDARLGAADLTHAPDLLAQAALAGLGVSHPGRRGWT